MSVVIKMLSIFKSIAISFVMLCISFQSISQALELEFTQIGIKEGLDQANVPSIVQDSDMFMWFATRNGLYKYDGYKIVVYRNNPKDSSSISDNHISCVYEDRKKNLWIGTMNGLNLFNRDQNKFTSFKHEPNNPSSIGGYGVQSIFEDREANLWIGTNDASPDRGGLNLYNNNGGFIHYTHNPNDATSIGSNVINCFYEDDNGVLWIGLNNGISCFDKKNKTFTTLRPTNQSNSLGGGMVSKIVEDRNKNLWITTHDGGLNVFNRRTKKFKHYFHSEKDLTSIGSNTLYSLLLDKAGNIWIGGEYSGLHLYNAKTDNFTIYRHIKNDMSSLSSNSIKDVYEDRSGNIWLGTYKGGVNMFSVQEKNFKHYNEGEGPKALSNNTVRGFCEDKENNIWTATEGGLHKFNTVNKKFTFYPNTQYPKSIGTDAVMCVHEDRYGMLWLGTWGGGLNLLDRKTNRFKQYKHDAKDSTSISGNDIYSMLEDRKGNLWACSFYNGLNLLNRKDGTFKRYKCHFRNEKIRILSILEDRDGFLWIGSNSSGIGKFDPVKENFIDGYDLEINKSHGLVGNGISSLHQDSKGRLWVGTEKGLNVLNPGDKKFSYINEIEDLNNNTSIQGILEDDNGNLWLSTLNSIIKFNPDKNTKQRFYNEDGLQGNEFVENSYMKASNGEMYFGGTNGFNVFHPNNFTKNTFIPPVYFTDFQIFNKSIEPGANTVLSKHISKTKEIILSYKQSVISFEYAALNYISTHKNQYAYMLEGFDEDWNYVGSKRTVTYTNLDPGEYTLKVKASNNDGVWNEEGTSLNLIITPPIWKTWWAYLFYLIIIFIPFYVFRRYSIIQIKAKNRLLIEGLENKKAAELTEAKMQFFTNISHEIRTPLTLIAGPLERVITENKLEPAIKKDLDSVQRNVKRLLTLASQLLQFRKLDMGHLQLNIKETSIVCFLIEIVQHFEQASNFKNIEISLENLTAKKNNLWIDREMITTVFYNLLSNALKSTAPGGKIIIKVYESTLQKRGLNNKIRSLLSTKHEDEAIAIEVMDTGKGIPPEELEKIFERFYQIPNPNHETSGSGLGLSLVKEYTEVHGGYIDVESKLDEGTSFTVYLPKGIKIENTKTKTNEVNISVSNEAFQEMEETEYILSANENIHAEKPLVLIVEDDAELSAYLHDSLIKTFRIEIAIHGKAGLNKALALLPDLIISDIAMPEMNGYTLCEKLKSDINTSHIPIILLTAKASDENIVMGYNYGADAYVPKPFNIKLVESQGKSLIRSRVLLREKYIKMMLVEPTDIVADSPDEKFLKQLMEITEANINNPKFNISYLVHQMSMSHSGLFKKIKSLTGLSLVEFIRNTRLKRAANIFKTEKLTVSEVCYRVGFEDPKYFSRCFTKEFGKTPTAYLHERDL